jgi:phosphate acetyltransferase
MARSLLVAPAAEDVGLARTCLGVLRALDRIGVRVDYFKPVAQPRADGTPDRSVARVAAVTTLRPPEPLSTAELERQLGEGERDVVREKIVAAWAPIYHRSDVVVVEGLKAGPSRLYAPAVNQDLARVLDADVLLVGTWSAEPDGVEGLAEQFAVEAGGYAAGDTARVVGCVVHGVPAARPSPVLKAPPAAARPETATLRTALGRHQLQLIAAVPHRPELTWPRVADMVRELNPEILHEGDLSRRIKDVAVFAQGIPGGIRVLDDGRLIVVPGDRHEVVMAACLAAMSGIRLAALLLSGGIRPDPRVWELAGPAAAGLPVLVVEPDSYQTATRVRDWDPGLPADDRDRIESVTNTIADALDASWLQSLPSPARPRRLTPAAFLYQLVEKARTADALIVLPEGTEPRTLRAAVACADRGIARCLLLGAPDEVAFQARLSVPITMSLPLTWVFAVLGKVMKLAIWLREVGGSGIIGARVTTDRLSGGAARVRLACLARSLRSGQRCRDPAPASPGCRPPAPGQVAEAVVGRPGGLVGAGPAAAQGPPPAAAPDRLPADDAALARRPCHQALDVLAPRSRAAAHGSDHPGAGGGDGTR